MKIPLHSIHEQLGATFINRNNWLIPESYNNWEEEYLAARDSIAIFDLSYRGKLKLKGNAVALLNNITTNDISSIKENEFLETAFLNSQARVLALATVYKLKDSLFLDSNPVSYIKILLQLMQVKNITKIIIEDLTRELSLFSIQGPLCSNLLKSFNIPEIKENQLLETSINKIPVQIAKRSHTGEEGYFIYIPTKSSESLWKFLTENHSIKPAGLKAYEALRIESGIPEYGLDITDSILILETNLDVINHKKGCYTGQEVIARMLSRNAQPQKKLLGLILPEEIGTVTSKTFSPYLNKEIALAYIAKSDLNNPNLIHLPFYKSPHLIINKLKQIKGIDNIHVLTEEDIAKISSLEDSNNLGVKECLSKSLVIMVTHNSELSPPEEEMVKIEHDNIIFPCIRFKAIDNAISSSPSAKVHFYLQKRFNLKLKDEATLLIGI